MTRSTRRTESRGPSAGLAVVLALGSVEPRQDAAATAATPEFGLAIDLTEDLYHRIDVGLLLPEREPLVLHARTRDGAGRDVPAADVFLRFRFEHSVLDVRTNANGAVAVHMDTATLLSHPVVEMPMTLSSMSRTFAQFPTHPVR